MQEVRTKTLNLFGRRGLQGDQNLPDRRKGLFGAYTDGLLDLIRVVMMDVKNESAVEQRDPA